MGYDTYDMINFLMELIRHVIMAVFCLVVGLRVFFTRRPFLISGTWHLAVGSVFFILGIVPNLVFSPANPMNWIVVILVGAFLLMLWYQLNSYVVYAFTDASFREALFAALQKLQLPHEESLSVIRLTSIDADLQVSIQSWIGLGNIKIKQKAHHSALREIAKTMNSNLRASSVSKNIIFCVFLVVAGVGFVGFTINSLDRIIFQSIF